METDTLVSNILNLRSSLSVTDSYKMTVKLTVFCVLIFRFLQYSPRSVSHVVLVLPVEPRLATRLVKVALEALIHSRPFAPALRVQSRLHSALRHAYIVPTGQVVTGPATGWNEAKWCRKVTGAISLLINYLLFMEILFWVFVSDGSASVSTNEQSVPVNQICLWDSSVVVVTILTSRLGASFGIKMAGE
jgi:hypothetical protein